VKDARESEEGYKRDSERYHDELNEIDHKIQLVRYVSVCAFRVYTCEICIATSRYFTRELL